MRNNIYYAVIISLLFFTNVSYAQLIPVLGSQRAGTAMGQFLKIGVGGRAASMGEAFVAVANDASALYWNPAGITQLEKNQVIFSHTNWPVDVRHDFLGYVHPLGGTSTIGLSFTALHTDDIEETTEFQPLGTGNFVSFGDIAIGLTFARKMTDRFSIGLTLKYVDENIAELHARNLFIDFGTFFWTGLGSTRFAVSVINFGRNMEPSGTLTLRDGTEISKFQDFSPPTVFRIGFAGEVIDTESNKITTSIQLNHLNDNAETFNLGVEYWWHSIVALRGGYRANVEEESFTFGAGLALPLDLVDLNVDISYADFGRLGNASRLSAILKF